MKKIIVHLFVFCCLLASVEMKGQTPYVITDTNPSSFLDALAYAGNNPGTTITFDIPGTGQQTIELQLGNTNFGNIPPNTTIDGGDWLTASVYPYFTPRIKLKLDTVGNPTYFNVIHCNNNAKVKGIAFENINLTIIGSNVNIRHNYFDYTINNNTFLIPPYIELSPNSNLANITIDSNTVAGSVNSISFVEFSPYNNGSLDGLYITENKQQQSFSYLVRIINYGNTQINNVHIIGNFLTGKIEISSPNPSTPLPNSVVIYGNQMIENITLKAKNVSIGSIGSINNFMGSLDILGNSQNITINGNNFNNTINIAPTADGVYVSENNDFSCNTANTIVSSNSGILITKATPIMVAGKSNFGAGVTVYVKTCDAGSSSILGLPAGSTTTDANGNWQFVPTSPLEFGKTVTAWANPPNVAGVGNNSTSSAPYKTVTCGESGVTISNSVTATTGTVKFTAHPPQIPNLNYTYKWYYAGNLVGTDSILTLTHQNNNNLNNGLIEVSLEVTMAVGCTDSIETLAFLPCAFNTVSAGANQTACVGSPAVILTAVPQGGIAPFLYEWSNNNIGTSKDTINTNVASDQNYFLTVTDGIGCVAFDTVNVKINAAPVVNPISDATVNCTTPSTTLTATGGTSYVWSSAATSAAITVTPSVTTTYTVTITNAAGCSKKDTVIVSLDKQTPNFNLNTPNPITCTTQTTTVSVTPSTNSYVWSNGVSGASITVTSAGLYSVTGTGANGCTTTKSITVGSNTVKPTANAGDDVTIGCGGSNSATITASGGGSYLWNTQANTAYITVSPTATTTYTVTVTTPNGCTATDAVVVTVGSPLANTDTLKVMAGGVNGFSGSCSSINLTLSSLATGSGLKYKWYKDNVVMAGDTSSVLPIGPTASVFSGIYYCSVSSNVCTGISKKSKSRIVSAPPYSVINGDNVATHNKIVVSNTNVISYEWRKGNGSTCTPNTYGPVINTTSTLKPSDYGGIGKYKLVINYGACTTTKYICVDQLVP